MVFNRGRKNGRAAYRVAASRQGVELEVDENFWNDTIIDEATGTSALDRNIATVCQEIRAALYFIATDAKQH